MFATLAAELWLWALGALPPALAPWQPLGRDDPPGFVRELKLRRARATPEACRATLSSLGLAASPVPDRVTGPGCGFTGAVRLRQVGRARLDEVTLACPAALALALWEHQVLQPAARAAFGSEVARLEHFGSYACRGVYGRQDARRSSHATASAIDLAGLRLADGRRIRVARDHRLTAREPEAATAAFLDAIARGACRSFSVVLTPAYNAAHRDHYHLEWTSGGRFCR